MGSNCGRRALGVLIVVTLVVALQSVISFASSVGRSRRVSPALSGLRRQDAGRPGRHDSQGHQSPR